MFYIVKKDYSNNTTSVSNFQIDDIESYLDNYLEYLKDRLIHSNIIYNKNRNSYYFIKIETITNKGYIYNSNIIRKTNLYKLKFVAVDYHMYNSYNFSETSDDEIFKFEECIKVTTQEDSYVITDGEVKSSKILYEKNTNNIQSELQLELQERFRYKNFGLNVMKIKND